VTYRFGRFSVDSDSRQLLADGHELHVSPKAFELLRTLIQHRARALSKAELQEQLWPSTFVGETNLATLVAEIRRALRDAARESKYVRTVHRFGYRFVADVAEVAGTTPGGDSGILMHLTVGGREFRLAEGTFVIGRAEDAAIRLDSGGVSRHHARIVVRGNEVRVEDLGSKNGTFVDDTAAGGGCLLRDGAVIRIGPVALTFSLTSMVQDTETMS
jgi:DNA-binding winged helix-turn-helix (wHTH) protein